MAKRTHNMIEELADAISEGRRSSDDYYEKVIDATVGHDRMLVGLYSLLAAGVVFLLFQAEMTPWAGAALVTSGALFLVGLAHTCVQIVTHHKMLLLADALRLGDETVDLETGMEEASAEAMARRLHSSETHYLFLGLLCAGIAAVIDHWQYGWRAFVVLAGLLVLFLLIELVPRIIRAVIRRSGDAMEDEADE